MLRTMIKKWYLCCYKCRCRNLNVYPNVNSLESTFLFRVNSDNPNSLQKNEETQQDRYFGETNAKSSCK